MNKRIYQRGKIFDRGGRITEQKEEKGKKRGWRQGDTRVSHGSLVDGSIRDKPQLGYSTPRCTIRLNWSDEKEGIKRGLRAYDVLRMRVVIHARIKY